MQLYVMNSSHFYASAPQSQMHDVVNLIILNYSTAWSQDIVRTVIVVTEVVNCFTVVILYITVVEHRVNIITRFRMSITPVHLCTGHSGNETRAITMTTSCSALASHQFNYCFRCRLQIRYSRSKLSICTAPTIWSRIWQINNRNNITTPDHALIVCP